MKKPDKNKKYHKCPYCKEIWVCGYPDKCKQNEESLCADHDSGHIRELLGGKWAE